MYRVNFSVTHQNASGFNRVVQPFMRIKCDGICFFHTLGFTVETIKSANAPIGAAEEVM